MIEHYVTMLRRYIVTDSDVAELCRQIYRSHKAAIDLIVEHMPDQQQEMSDHLAGLVQAEPGLEVVRHIKSYVDFVPQAWTTVPEFNLGHGLGKYGPATVTFQFYNSKKRLTLYLTLGPVSAEHEYVREAIFAHAAANPSVFKGCRPKLSAHWTVLYKHSLLRASDLGDATLEELVVRVEPKLERFFNDILPELDQHMMQVQFPK
jgi:hypothetical protein